MWESVKKGVSQSQRRGNVEKELKERTSPSGVADWYDNSVMTCCLYFFANFKTASLAAASSSPEKRTLRGGSGQGKSETYEFPPEALQVTYQKASCLQFAEIL